MCTLMYTSCTAQGGGGSFKDRKPIGEVGCCYMGHLVCSKARGLDIKGVKLARDPKELAREVILISKKSDVSELHRIICI